MKAISRVALLTAVCGLGLWSANDAQAGRGFLKNLLNRGSSCQSACCETQSCCAPSNRCGFVRNGGYVQAFGCAQGCGGCASCGGGGCGNASPASNVQVGGVIFEPTEASPADATPAVPAPPAVEAPAPAVEAPAPAVEAPAAEAATEAAVGAVTEG